MNGLNYFPCHKIHIMNPLQVRQAQNKKISRRIEVEAESCLSEMEMCGEETSESADKLLGGALQGHSLHHENLHGVSPHTSSHRARHN